MSKRLWRWTELLLLCFVLAGCAGAPSQGGDDSRAPLNQAVDPEIVAAHQSALHALQAGRQAEAERGFLRLTQQHPHHRGPWLNLGIALMRQGKTEEAEMLFQQVLQRYPDFAEVHHELAVLQRQAGRFAAARQSYAAAIAARPDFALAHRNLGLLCDLYLHDTNCALSNYQKFQKLTLVNDEEVEQWIADLRRRVPAQK